MATLDSLIERILSGMVSENPRGLENRLYKSSAADIDDRSADTARQINESTFGRGLGLSSVTADLQADREQIRQEALVKARRDAAMASRSAILAALSQAAGLQGQRQQQGQFDENMRFRQKELDERGSAQNKALLAQGIGGLGGAALQTGGLMYGPEIKGALNRLMGRGPGGSPSASVSGQLGSASALPPTLDGLADFGSASFSSPTAFEDAGYGGSFDPGAFDTSGFDLGGLDASGLGGWDFGMDFEFPSTLDLLSSGGGWT
jgi:hypothetical protein